MDISNILFITFIVAVSIIVVNQTADAIVQMQICPAGLLSFFSYLEWSFVVLIDNLYSTNKIQL
jgi:hypothetical protein